jgi:hypothetical protein
MVRKDRGRKMVWQKKKGGMTWPALPMNSWVIPKDGDRIFSSVVPTLYGRKLPTGPLDKGLTPQTLVCQIHQAFRTVDISWIRKRNYITNINFQTFRLLKKSPGLVLFLNSKMCLCHCAQGWHLDRGAQVGRSQNPPAPKVPRRFLCACVNR